MTNLPIPKVSLNGTEKMILIYSRTIFIIYYSFHLKQPLENLSEIYKKLKRRSPENSLGGLLVYIHKCFLFQHQNMSSNW